MARNSKVTKTSQLLKSKNTSTIPSSDRREPGKVKSSKFSNIFPFGRYTSVVGVHTSLLAFTAIFLPQTTSFVPPGLLSPETLDKLTAEPGNNRILASLTAHPALTLAWICPGVAILQAWWAGWLRQWSLEISSDASATASQQKLQRKEDDEKKSLQCRNAWLATLISSMIIHAILFCYGAPLLSHIIETYLLSLTLSTLTIFSPAYLLGVPSFRGLLPSALSTLTRSKPEQSSVEDQRSLFTRLIWVKLFAELHPTTPIERALVYPAVGAVLGCWAGIIPMGLDWERPWQAWPLPPTFGAIGGYVLGSLTALGESAVRELAVLGSQQGNSKS